MALKNLSSISNVIFLQTVCLLCSSLYLFRVDFIEQFEVVPVRVGKPPNKKEEPHFGTSFEPSSIYKMLSKIRSETFKVEGRQEDAEEFLSCLLNGLHDEMIEIMKSVKDVAESQSQPAENKQTTGSEDEDWQVNYFSLALSSSTEWWALGYFWHLFWAYGVEDFLISDDASLFHEHVIWFNIFLKTFIFFFISR